MSYTGKIFYIYTDDNQATNITEVLFPGQSSNIPQNKLLNMTFNCATGQLDVHIKLNDVVQIDSQVLSLSNPVLSIRATVNSQSSLKIMILSANTQMFSLQAFVAVKHDFQMSLVFIKGMTASNTLNQVVQLKSTLDMLPNAISGLKQSKITAFFYSMNTKQLVLMTTLEEITMIPNILKLKTIAINIDTTMNPTPAINHLTFSGTWQINTISVKTNVAYSIAKKLLHLTAQAKSGQTLNIGTLMKNIAGISHNIPSPLTSLSLHSVVGNIYSSGKFFIAMSGTIVNGKMYLLFYNGANGIKVGIAASIANFHLSDLLKSATGVDNSRIPYFGRLVVPSMAIAITSGTIQSSTLPHLFRTGSPLLYYNNTLPPGVTSHFKIDIGSVKGVYGNFAHGVIHFKFLDSVYFDIKSLAIQIPGMNEAIKSLPPELTKFAYAKVVSLSFNSTTKDFMISASLKQFSLMSWFLFFYDVKISYNGVLDTNLTTRLVEFVGTWNIGSFPVLTNLQYDGIKNELTASSQSQAGKQFSTQSVLQSLADTEIPLPSELSSFTFTGLSCRVAQSTAVITVNGHIKGGKICVVFEKHAQSDTKGAVVADISNFKLSDLIHSATGIDVSGIPFLGSLVIPKLMFAEATGNISNPLLAKLSGSGSPLELFKNGIDKGVSGLFTIKLGGVNGISVKFIQYLLEFTVPDASTLHLDVIVSKMLPVKNILQKLPPQLLVVLNAKITKFIYDPTAQTLQFIGSIENKVIFGSQFLSLTSVKISLTIGFSKSIAVTNLDFIGNWVLKTFSIPTTVSYNHEEQRLDISGDIGSEGNGIDIKKLITSLSGKNLPIPPTLSSVTLKTLSGNQIGNVTFVILSGSSVGHGTVYLIYQHFPDRSSIAFAADKQRFGLSSLVSSTLGLDITSFPFFGSLVIPRIGFTISSDIILNPTLSLAYQSNSPLLQFGNTISKGVKAAFNMSIGTTNGLVADYVDEKLGLTVPDSVTLSLVDIMKTIPGLTHVINTFPATPSEQKSACVHKILYDPSEKSVQLTGSLKSLTITPGFLILQNAHFAFSGIIAANTSIKFASSDGDWLLKSLMLKTKIEYENQMLLIEALPNGTSIFDLKQFITSLSGKEYELPMDLKDFQLNNVIGSSQKKTISLVFLGEIGSKGNAGLAYQKSPTGGFEALAMDLSNFKLAHLIQIATGFNISSVPFFGTYTIPTLSLVICTCSNESSTALFPELNITGMPKQLLSPIITEGFKSNFLVNIGSAGIEAKFMKSILTMEVPPSVSLSLRTLLSVIPEMKGAIHSFPPAILNAKIKTLVLVPETKDLYIFLALDSLTIVPQIISLKKIEISLDQKVKTVQVEIQNANMFKHPISAYRTPFQFHSSAVISTEIVTIQSMSIDSFLMSGKWTIRGVEIDTTTSYDKVMNEYVIIGAPTGDSSISIVDLIDALSGTTLSVPKILSSLKLKKVVARTDTKETIIVLRATAGSSDVYVIFQKRLSGSSIAIAADIQQFKLADLIKTATKLDVSGVPLLGSFVITTLAFSVATKEISDPLLDETIDNDSPLQAYGGTMPKGLTAYFKGEIGAVGIEVTYAESILDIKVPDDKILSLQALLSQIPSLNDAMQKIPSPLSNLLACELRALRIDPTSKTLSLTAKFAKFTIIPNILQIQNLEISFTAILSSTNGGLQSLSFSADWILRNINIRIMVSYDRASSELLFAAIPKQGLNIGNLITGLTGQTLPIPSVINSVKLIKIIGQKSADVFTFIFSGSIAGKADVHLVYKKFGDTSQITIAAGIQSFLLKDLVQSAVNIDISSIPFFGTFSVPRMGIIISNDILTTSLLTASLLENSPLSEFGDSLPKGFSAKFIATIGSMAGLHGSYENKVISISIPPNVDSSVQALLSVIPGVVKSSFALPSVFGDILKIKLRSFSFDISNKAMSVEIFLAKITFFEDLLSLSNTELKLLATLSTPKAFSAEAKSTITLGSTNYNVNFKRDPTTTKYVLTIETENLPIFGIVKALGSALLPDDLNAIIGQVFNFNVLNAKIVYPFGGQQQQMLISGTPVIFGIKTAQLTAVAIKYGGKMRIVQKYSFGKFKLTDFLKKLLGISVGGFTLLQQEVDIAITVSSTTMTKVTFVIPEFSGITNINRGISFRIGLGWPANCASDAFCAVAQKILGAFKLSLEATIANARSFSMTASIGNLKLGGGVVLERAGLQIVVGTSPSIGVVGSISLKNPAITLSAAIRATISGVKLEGSMSGCWNNAFGSSYLTICNLFIAMTIVPAPLPITGLELGGRIEVGKKSCGKVITAEGYIGINVINPNQNYFYADIGPVTFQSFFDAFCLSINLPAPLAESGFPKGIKTSFSLFGKELPHAHISIPPGYRFKGTLNILGLEAYADVNIQLPTKIYINAGLPPMRIASIFKMYASRTDKSKGPYLIVDISTSKPPHIEANGFVEVLGISLETKLLITKSKYELSITGRFLNLFEAGLRLTANYGSFSKANFMVEGWFKNDLFDRIAKIVRDGLKKSADEADKHISAAQNKIRSAQLKLDGVNRGLENAKRKLDGAKRSFDSAISKLEKARRVVNNICHIRRCGSGEKNISK